MWDGIGAWIKRTVRRDIIDNRPPLQKTVHIEGEHILTPVEVAEHVKATFNTDEYVATHLKKTINEVVVIYTPTSEVKRPAIEWKYSAMNGMKKTYLFMAVRDGVLLQRPFACWCAACMQASAPGEGSMDSNYKCMECESQELEWKETCAEREVGLTTASPPPLLYPHPHPHPQPWPLLSPLLQDAPGIAARRAVTLAHAKDQARQLAVNFETEPGRAIWVAVQNRGEDDPDQYWIGRALSMEQYTESSQSRGGVGRSERYDKGDYKIKVEWFQRDISGGDERRIFR